MLHFFFQFEEQSSLSFIAPLFSRGKIVLLKSIDRSEAVDTNGDSLIRQKTNLSDLSTTSIQFFFFTLHLEFDNVLTKRTHNHGLAGKDINWDA